MVEPYVWTFASAEETQQFARRLAEYLQPGDVLALEGDLGAGKTTFTQGLARGLGVAEGVNSPTFTIIKEYAGRLPLYHMDVYRVENDADQLGLDEYFYGDGVSVVEWASLIEPVLPEERLTVTLSVGEGQARRCRLEPRGRRYEELCEEIGKHAHFGN
ncbi:tRNA (adenosine(37)-N6)-threonylcarbamoyltransferase complex ATPase subunit type 1 TsaE [Brevibacillus massiliensis]|jgi:tRNA threonylcarbamoyladenosine biosynthesis protein TsaE|uniref:tRNA (adenosine(37)-N6)-threonylcarbamoyltransferase complex ATPase subunit type 1 TsaE n=1 Tax=Brevibacillus massiliensis TaxID=1118054 RepID=UPI00030223AE|nr:tRNA (adenosine(37)-N6)-threonylcarbamoyltransferase complex ATPase subunit type 1 TsaE [Brevibacillus massiliensis]